MVNNWQISDTHASATSFTWRKMVSGDQRNKQPDLPFCVGMEVLLDKKALESAATNIDVYAHKTEDGQSSSQPRTHTPAPARHADLTQVQRLDGLDVVGVQTVINDACPRDLSCYGHRVGRTARVGRGGCAVSITKWSQITDQMEDQVASIVQEEREERALRKAEMEATQKI